MTDFQTVIGLVLAAFVLVGVPFLIAMPRKRVETEEESEQDRRYREMSQ